MRKTLVLLAMLSAVAGPSAHATGEPVRTESRSYLAPIGDTGTVTCAGLVPGGPQCFGGATFPISAADETVTIDAVDGTSGLIAPGFSWEVWQEANCGDGADELLNGCAVARGSGCGHLEVNLPNVGGQLVVLIDGPVFGPLNCGRYVGASVQGEVTINVYR